MTVLHYCTLVERAVRLTQPEPYEAKRPTCELWFYDTGQATAALNWALEGNIEKALRLAEPLAEKYWSHIDKVQEQLRAASQ